MANRSDALARANELMEQFYSDPEARRQYEAVRKYEMDQWMFEDEFTRRGMEKGLKEGFEKGVEQGIKKGIEQGIEQGIEKGIKQGIQEGIVQGIEQGIEQGLEQGSTQEKLRIAESLRDMGISPEVIRKATGLEL